jgi:hypothetical protein
MNVLYENWRYKWFQLANTDGDLSVKINLEYRHLEPKKNKLNSVALVRKRTIPTEQPPLVGEVSANFRGYRMSHGKRNGYQRPLISVL